MMGSQCGACGATFAGPVGLDAHLTLSRHRARHVAAANGAAVTALRGTEPDPDVLAAAKPFTCTYPGCGKTFRSYRGLAIHRGLMGHRRIRDSVENGDGGRDLPRHPAYRQAD